MTIDPNTLLPPDDPERTDTGTNRELEEIDEAAADDEREDLPDVR